MPNKELKVTINEESSVKNAPVFVDGICSAGKENRIKILQSYQNMRVTAYKAEDVLKPQFSGKNVGQFTYTKTGAMTSDEIDAISGATITTNAVVNGVNVGLSCFKNELGGGVNE